MPIFDNIERTYTGPATHTEDPFAYYNRSARISILRIRRLLESWFDRYPTSEQSELASRFRADFNAAFFELFLHELAINLGAEVTTHSSLPSGTEKRPDFRLRDSRGESYLEARVARDESKREAGRQRILADVYDAINSLHVADFYLQLSDVQLADSTKQPSMRRMKRMLREWIASLNYEKMRTNLRVSGNHDALPSQRFKDPDLSFTVTAIPVSPEKRGRGHRPIGVYPMESKWGGTSDVLKRALERKSTRYGTIEAPFLIAVNSLSNWSFDHIDEQEALFGGESIVVYPGSEEHSEVREPNGFWFGPTGPIHTRVSGVLFCRVHPSNLHDAPMCLYPNPWAQRPYDGVLATLTHYALSGVNQMRRVEGVKSGEVLNLPSDWLNG